MNTYSQTTCIMASIGEGNVGDEAILAGTVQAIRSKHPDARIIVFSHNPAATEQQHPGVIAYPVLPAGIRSYCIQTVRGIVQKSLRTLKIADDILIGGGGIFYDSDFSAGKNPVEVWHTRCNTIRRLGKRYRLYAIGVSALHKETSKRWMNDICTHASSITVRDEISEHNLRTIGVKNPIEIVEDPALSLQAPHHTASRNKQKTIAISVRQWFITDHEKRQQYEQNLVRLLTSLAHLPDVHILLVPMADGVENDRAFMERIGTHVDSPRIAISKAPHTVDARLEEIAQADMLIGMRLHALIFAHITGTPWIALGYAQKVKSLAAHLGHLDHYHDLEPWPGEAMLAQIKELL